MGYLGNQPPRSTYDPSGGFEGFLDSLVTIAKEKRVTLEMVIAAHHVYELGRQNSIAIQDGDYRDEQMAGIGECLKEIAAAITTATQE